AWRNCPTASLNRRARYKLAPSAVTLSKAGSGLATTFSARRTVWAGSAVESGPRAHVQTIQYASGGFALGAIRSIILAQVLRYPSRSSPARHANARKYQIPAPSGLNSAALAKSAAA